MGVREGKKKTKLLLANCHMHYMIASNTLHHRAQGSLAKFGGQEISAGVTTYPNRKKNLEPFSSLVVRMSCSSAMRSNVRSEN